VPIDVPVENSSLGVLTLSTINGSAKIDRPPLSDGDLMDSKQEAMFEQVLLEAVDQAKAFDYHPNRFVAMIRSKGPFQTVKDIVASAKPSDGFNELQSSCRPNGARSSMKIFWRSQSGGSLRMATLGQGSRDDGPRLLRLHLGLACKPALGLLGATRFPVKTSIRDETTYLSSAQ
jgi:hypothetical protein